MDEKENRMDSVVDIGFPRNKLMNLLTRDVSIKIL
jgi:hypothetical protein